MEIRQKSRPPPFLAYSRKAGLNGKEAMGAGIILNYVLCHFNSECQERFNKGEIDADTSF
jgi:hypothetical protein